MRITVLAMFSFYTIFRRLALTTTTLGIALERRRFGQQDRTWTNPEFGKLIGRAMAEEREDLMSLLGIGRNTAYELIRSGQIRSVRIGRQIRIPRDALLEFLQK